MKKALKVIGKVLLGIVAVLVVFLIGTCVYDKICLASEKDLLENQIYGQKVEVYGHDMSIYVSGSGDHTLVFMAGSGDSAPIIGYKSFIDRFDEDYRVVVIEKFGYGFSDAFDGSRDVETRVAQNREALKKAGIDPNAISSNANRSTKAMERLNQIKEETRKSLLRSRHQTNRRVPSHQKQIL